MAVGGERQALAFYPWYPFYMRLGGPWDDMESLEKRKSLVLTRVRTPDRPACNKSLKQLRCPPPSKSFNVNHTKQLFFSMAQKPLVGQSLPIIEAPQFIQTHNTLGRTPLDEWSARRRYLYLTKHNTHKRQISMPLEGFEPAFPVSERPKTHALAWPLGSAYQKIFQTKLCETKLYIAITPGMIESPSRILQCIDFIRCS
jgi:hypothetical protein